LPQSIAMRGALDLWEGAEAPLSLRRNDLRKANQTETDNYCLDRRLRAWFGSRPPDRRD
jgi:hypothetical protein